MNAMPTEAPAPAAAPPVSVEIPEATASSVDAATVAAMGLVTPDKTVEIAGILRMIATDIKSKGGDPASHPAIRKTAAEHTPAEIKQLLSYVHENIEESAEAAGPYLAQIDAAKAIIVGEFDLDLSAELPKDGDAPAKAAKPAKAPKAAKEPKAPKAVKEAKVKEPKAAKEPPPEAAILDVEVYAVKSAEHALPEEAKRADLLPKPDLFILEVGTARTGKNVHQVDPSRVQSCTPVMPNLDLLAKTGNPYPVKADETVKTAERYYVNVAISHFTYTHFASVKTMKGHPDKDVVAAILTQAGAKDNAESRTTIQDTLRDLCLYGLATQQIQQKTRIFTLK